MDKNSNFYKAIEKAIINESHSEMKNIPDEPHEFSEEYRKKIAQITEDEKNEKAFAFGFRKIKMSAKTLAILISAAVLTGAFTVVASESARNWVKEVFSFKNEKPKVVRITVPAVTSSVTAVTQPHETDTQVSTCTTIITTLPQTETSNVTTTITGNMTSNNTFISSDYSSTSTTTVPTSIVTTFVIPVYPSYNYNSNQRPSMMMPSYPKVTTTYNNESQDSESTTTTVIDSMLSGAMGTNTTAAPPITEVSPNTDKYCYDGGTSIVTQIIPVTSAVAIPGTMIDVIIPTQRVTSIVTSVESNTGIEKPPRETPGGTPSTEDATDSPEDSYTTIEVTSETESDSNTTEISDESTYTTTIKKSNGLNQALKFIKNHINF